MFARNGDRLPVMQIVETTATAILPVIIKVQILPSEVPVILA